VKEIYNESAEHCEHRTSSDTGILAGLAMWQAIGLVSSGVTLVAFLSAVAAWAYKRKLVADAELIRTAPESDRANLVLAHYGYLIRVDTSNLTRAQKFDTINRQLNAAAAKYKVMAAVVVIIAILASCLTMFALWQNSGRDEAETRLEEKEERLAEILVVRDKLQQKLDEEVRRSSQLAGGIRFAVISSKADVNPEVKALANALQDLLEQFESDFDASRFSGVEDLSIRISKATLANAERRHRDALSLVRDEDVDKLREATEGTIDREIAGLEIRGDAWYGLREWAKAQTCYERIVQLRPERMLAVYEVGLCAYWLRQTNTALEIFSKLVTYYTRLVETGEREEINLAAALNSRGTALCDLGKPEDAVKDLERAIEIYTRVVKTEGSPGLLNDLAVAHNNLGTILRNLKKFQAAIKHYDTAIDVRTQLVETEGRQEFANYLAMAHNNRGIALMDLNKRGDAIKDYGKAIEIYSRLFENGSNEIANDLAMAHLNRGAALSDLGKLEDAMQEYQKAIDIRTHLVETEGRKELENDLAMAHNNRGNLFRRLVKFDVAITDFDKAIDIRTRLIETEGHKELENSLATTYRNRGMTYRKLEKFDTAIRDFDKAIDIRTRLIETEGRKELEDEFANDLNSRGIAFRNFGKPGSAVKDFDKAIEICTRLIESAGRQDLVVDLAMEHDNRRHALIDLGKTEDAIQDSEMAIKIYTRLVETDGLEEFADDLADVLKDLAWLHATCPDEKFRNGTRAVDLALHHCKLVGWTNFDSLDTLAAAYAEMGEFDSAVKWEVKALNLAPEDAKEELGARLKLFQSTKPFRDKRGS
jgi:tetratricopeptide (TPR) repeat protein